MLCSAILEQVISQCCATSNFVFHHVVQYKSEIQYIFHHMVQCIEFVFHKKDLVSQQNIFIKQKRPGALHQKGPPKVKKSFFLEGGGHLGQTLDLVISQCCEIVHLVSLCYVIIVLE